MDIRVISATAKDLPHEIERGAFREELFHRLNVVPIAVPSLEERREDISVLAEHFLVEFHANRRVPDPYRRQKVRRLWDETGFETDFRG